MVLVNSKQIEALVKVRDGLAIASDGINEYIDTFAPKDKAEMKVPEATFTTLKFEAQQGAKLGVYEVAYAPNNKAETFKKAFGVLHEAKATIRDRYHGKGYVFSYWLYGESKIYRQKLKGEKP
jgi:hypothetical protein